MFGFVSFSFFGFALVIKLRSSEFESLKYFNIFDKKDVPSDLNIYHGKMFHFPCLASLNHKTEQF